MISGAVPTFARATIETLDDWGRSESLLSLIDPVLNFYYRYWFRVETEGIENIPSEGGALLVSNHSGALPPDAPEAAFADRIGWLREAAGPRFEQLELNLNLMAVGDQVPRYVASQLGLTAEKLARAGAVPAVVGSTDEMCQTLLERRGRLGLSYFVVGDELMEVFAPVVQRLSGK